MSNDYDDYDKFNDFANEFLLKTSEHIQEKLGNFVKELTDDLVKELADELCVIREEMLAKTNMPLIDMSKLSEVEIADQRRLEEAAVWSVVASIAKERMEASKSFVLLKTLEMLTQSGESGSDGLLNDDDLQKLLNDLPKGEPN